MTTPPTLPLNLFYSYAQNPQDEALLAQLDTHLAALKRAGHIATWHKQNILAGAEHLRETEQHLNTASIILLLISPDYIASDYCYGTEIQRAMQRHDAGEAHVIPILLRYCYYTGTPFEKLQSLPTNGKPITSWPDRDEAFADVAREIHKAIMELSSVPAPTPVPDSPSQSIWNIPYSRNPFFTGREQLLTQLRTNLTTTQTATLTQPQAISGLGGIGKTQTAVEYAYRYRAILWTTAATREGLGLEFVKLAALLSLPQYDTQEATVTAVKSWLAQHSDWLLILDNADDLPIASDFLPERRSTNGHVLLTTRADVVGILANPLAVEKMDTEEGILLLLRRTRLLAADAQLPQASSYHRAQAASIVREMDGLPLALDQAGAYIEETSCGLPGYLTLYRTHHQQLLEHRSKYRSDHPAPVATTWSLSFQEVEKANPAAADLLRLCAFLAPDAIPEKLLTNGQSALPSTLQSLATDSFKLNEAIEVLRRYSLIKRDPTTETFAVHRLVQVVLKDSMPKRTQQRWAERVLHALRQAFPKKVDVTTWPQCPRYLPHVQVGALLIDQYALHVEEAAWVLYQAGRYLYQQAQYDEAESLYKQVLVIYEKGKGTDHLFTAKTLHQLAVLYGEQGNYKKAERLYRQALTIYKKSLSAEHPLTGNTLHQLAILYWMQGKYEEAELLYQQALAISEKMEGYDHPSTATTLHSLAMLYYTQCKYEEAEGLYHQALTIYEKSLPTHHPYTATTLNALASLYEAQGKYEEAEPLYLRSMTIMEKLLPNHPNTALVLESYAGFLRKVGREKEAIELEGRARAIREKRGEGG